MMRAAFCMTSSSLSPDGLLRRSIKACFSASCCAICFIAADAFSASASAIFCITAFALGTALDAAGLDVACFIVACFVVAWAPIAPTPLQRTAWVVEQDYGLPVLQKRFPQTRGIASW